MLRRAALGTAFVLLAGASHAAGNAKNGEDIFNRCGQCHNAIKGGGNGMGPNLFGVVGRKAASLPSFPYSDSLKNSKLVWTEANLKKWVMGPQKMVPGTRMSFAGLIRPQDAEDVVAYLKTRK